MDTVYGTPGTRGRDWLAVLLKKKSQIDLSEVFFRGFSTLTIILSLLISTILFNKNAVKTSTSWVHWNTPWKTWGNGTSLLNCQLLLDSLYDLITISFDLAKMILQTNCQQWRIDECIIVNFSLYNKAFPNTYLLWKNMLHVV